VEDAISWHVTDDEAGAALKSLVREVRPDAAVSMAWYAQPGRYLEDASENLRALDGTIRLLEALLDAQCTRVVLAGTCLENMPPATPYAASKLAAHTAAAQLRSAGLRATCAHVFYLYGPEEDPERVIPTVVRSLLRGEPVQIREGGQLRDYLHVSDVASAFCRLVDIDPGATVDICTGRPVRLGEVVDVIGRQTGRSDLIRYLEGAGRDASFPATGDPMPLRSTGWTPGVGLEAGIRDSISSWTTELRSPPDRSVAADRRS
jgi:nucleoside-diphosphate-sugar epimerase